MCIQLVKQLQLRGEKMKLKGDKYYCFCISPQTPLTDSLSRERFLNIFQQLTVLFTPIINVFLWLVYLKIGISHWVEFKQHYFKLCVFFNIYIVLRKVSLLNEELVLVYQLESFVLHWFDIFCGSEWTSGYTKLPLYQKHYTLHTSF